MLGSDMTTPASLNVIFPLPYEGLWTSSVLGSENEVGETTTAAVAQQRNEEQELGTVGQSMTVTAVNTRTIAVAKPHFVEALYRGSTSVRNDTTQHLLRESSSSRVDADGSFDVSWTTKSNDGLGNVSSPPQYRKATSLPPFFFSAGALCCTILSPTSFGSNFATPHNLK